MKRVGFAALVAAAIFAPLLIHRTVAALPSASDPVGEKLDSLRILSYELHRQASSLHAHQEVEDIMAGAAALRSDTPLVLVRGFPARTDRRPLDAAITSTWHRIAHPDPHVRVVFVVHAMDPHGRQYSGSAVVESDSFTVCIGLITANRGPSGELRAFATDLSTSGAPCWYYAEFGRPGRTMGAWLSRSRHGEAYSDTWLNRPKDFSGHQPPIMEWWEFVNVPAFLMGGRSFGLADLAELMSQPYRFGASGLRCMSGIERDCGNTVVDPDFRNVDSIMPAELTASLRTMAPRSSRFTDVRAVSEAFLPALVNEFGRDRFREFWKSDEEFPLAFSHAFGKPLDAWTAGWVHREWTAAFEGIDNRSIELGVTLHPVWSIAVLFWSVVCLLVTAIVARRRVA